MKSKNLKINNLWEISKFNSLINQISQNKTYLD